MYHNPYFWLGEVGLILTAISSAMFLHRFRGESWLQILPFFFSLISALHMLVRPAIYNMDHTIPAAPYLFRLAVGLVFASRAFVWRNKSLSADKLMMDRIWKVLAIVAGLFLFYLGFRLKNK